MVSNMMDMLGRDDAEPDKIDEYKASDEEQRKLALIEEIAGGKALAEKTGGEAIITFKNGHTTEVHGDDTHFYPEYGVLFTEDETPDDEDAETWYFARDIIAVQRH